MHTDEYRYLETLKPLIANSQGRELFFQFQFETPPGCPSATKPSASGGLRIRIQ